ncbi:MAG: hypothetical protein ABIK28_13120 [Planctomycetota bacterium]
MKTCPHPERPAAARCVVCGEVLCEGCRVFKKKKNYCIRCAPGKPSGYRSPTFSMFLSLIPGLGQFYTGAFIKGLMLLVGTGACCVSGGSGGNLPLVVPMMLLLYSTWDARMTALKRNYALTGGRAGAPGAGQGDWMLLLGSMGLAVLYTVLPIKAGVEVEPWALWVAYSVVLFLSALLGRGGQDVKQA